MTDNCSNKIKVIITYVMKEISLVQLELEKSAEIIGYFDGASEKVMRRVLELGFTVGNVVRIEHKSMLGEVLLLSIRGYLISLVSDIAKIIKVRVEH